MRGIFYFDGLACSNSEMHVLHIECEARADFCDLSGKKAIAPQGKQRAIPFGYYLYGNLWVYCTFLQPRVRLESY